VSPADEQRLLRAYPRRWRARYGDELLAMIEDELGGARPSWRLRLSLAGAGVRQRLRGGGPERVRAGVVAVLWGWTLFVVAGCALAKAAEHWRAATPHGSRLVPALALGVMQAVAVLSALGVAAAALSVAAPLRDFLRDGGRPAVRRPVLRAAGLSVLALAGLAAIVVWAHRLPASRRDGSDAPYALAVLAVGLALAAAACAWVAVAARVLRGLVLSPRTLALHAGLARAVAAGLVVMTAGAAAWWAAVASAAPWFIAGRAPGAAASGWSPELAAVLCLMLVACAVALTGARRIADVRA
jgi:hypothetical protein